MRILQSDRLEVCRSYGLSSSCRSCLVAILLFIPCACYAEVVATIIERLSLYREEVPNFEESEVGLKIVDEGIYEGEFSEDRPHGTGILLFDDDRVYQGGFVNGNRTGYGTLTWPNGDVYEGLFFQNDISGIGELFRKESGERYRGLFLNGLKQGSGEYEWLDGRRYVGSFHNDAQEGRGDYYLTNGTIYRGYFSNNQRHGEGVLFSNDGSIEFQRWNHGVLIERMRVQLTDHCRLEIEDRLWMFRGGNCINGLAHGLGMAVRSDGLAYITNAEVVLGSLVSGVITSLDPIEIP